MINFGELEIAINQKYSFVGIEKQGSKLIFHIPKGFSQSDISSLNTFDKKRDLFFYFYRVLNVFEQTCLEKGYFETQVVTKVKDRDGVVKDDSGSEITSNNDSKNIFYSKIDSLGSILDAYDELKILGLVSRLGKTQKLDYSKLHQFLNKAIFLDNGAIYIDSMYLPRKEIHFDATDIVAMYCYILTEIKEQLQQKINPEISSLAELFREKYLGSEYSLFSEQYYQQVINLLKDTLEKIDNYTPVKDVDYWDFYEAIEAFLFGELDTSIEGNIWGISNFYSVWEAMCLTFLARKINPSFILYLDYKFISNEILKKLKEVKKIIDISDIFNINGIDIFPDAVIINSHEKYKQVKSNKTEISYELKIDNWNDYGYLTTFSYKLDQREIKIAYVNQSSSSHTSNELEKEKFCQINSNVLTITSLTNKYYSFWKPDEFSFNELEMMRRLNHVFILSFKEGFLKFEDFYKKNIEPYNIFTVSLFRSYSKNFLNKLYENFINSCFSYYFCFIDIKYTSLDYYINSENIEEIKNRSIRKQFVYEYLLQKYLERTNSSFKELDIKSFFWLPSYFLTNKKTFRKLPKYMDDYVKLRGVNIMTVIDSYLELEKT